MRHLDSRLSVVVDEVLHYLWDPIGVSGDPWARDEYQSYIGPVLAMLSSGASESEIAYRLSQIVVEQMGLNACSERSSAAALALVKWRRHFDEQAG